MIQVERSLAATPRRAWERVGDLESWAEMLPTIDAIASMDRGPIGVGSRFRVRGPGLPVAEYVVTDWTPPNGFTWQARSAGVATTATHVLTQRDGQTTLRLGIAWTGPMAWLVRAVLTRKARSYVIREADTFVALVNDEQSQAGHPPETSSPHRPERQSWP